MYFTVQSVTSPQQSVAQPTQQVSVVTQQQVDHNAMSTYGEWLVSHILLYYSLLSFAWANHREK